MKKLKSYFLPVSIILMTMAFLFVSVALINTFTRQHVINTVTVAAKNGDIFSLKNRTDWPELRAWMKDDLHKRTKTIAAKSSGYDMSDQAVDDLVDYYVQPANLPSLIYFHNQLASNVNVEDFVRNVRFTGMKEMTMEISFPPQEDKPWVNYLEPVKAVFQLDNMTWKLKKLHTPLYLVPQKAPTPAHIGKAVPADKTGASVPQSMSVAFAQ